MKFKLEDKVRIVKDVNGGYFVGCEGIIEDLDKNELYGLRIYKANKIFTEAHMEIGNSVLYFKEEELELI